MQQQLTRNNIATAHDSASGIPLHQQMSQEDRIIWSHENHGIFKEIASKHRINGKPASRAYVSAIFYGKNRVKSPASRRISQSIDDAILKSLAHRSAAA